MYINKEPEKLGLDIIENVDRSNWVAMTVYVNKSSSELVAGMLKMSGKVKHKLVTCIDNQVIEVGAILNNWHSVVIQVHLFCPF